MCSKKCDNPVQPGRSLREPARKNVYSARFGIERSGHITTRMPFERVSVLISLGSTARAGRAASGTSASTIPSTDWTRMGLLRGAGPARTAGRNPGREEGAARPVTGGAPGEDEAIYLLVRRSARDPRARAPGWPPSASIVDRGASNCEAAGMIVMKFGGTSVGSAAPLRNAVALVTKVRDRDPVVVVSATSGVTDLLVRFGHEPLERRAL